jgi:hypothetical protein
MVEYMCSDLDGLPPGKARAKNKGGILQHDEVEPAAATTTASGGANFKTHLITMAGEGNGG